METTSERYARRPFIVDVVEITKDNVDELAKDIGTVKYDRDSGDPYIIVDKTKMPGLNRVHIGYMMTRMDGHIRCYRPELFAEQFVKVTPGVEASIVSINGQ